MPQFDLYDNPNRAQREGFPFLVVVQNDQLDHYTTRFVMPLARLGQVPPSLPRRLAQTVQVRGEALFPAAHLCAALPVQILKRPVASVRDQSDVIRDALDAVLSGV